MNISTADRAQVLTQALPYIKQYAGKTVVIKYGGNAMISDELKSAVMEDIVLPFHRRDQGGARPRRRSRNQRDAEKDRQGIQIRERPAVYRPGNHGNRGNGACREGEQGLVQQLEQHGGRAIGLCGLDGGMIKAVKMKGEADLGFVGDITHVNVTLICNSLESGTIPVVATVAAGDGDGETYNINADIAASQIAAALCAEKLVLMTDVRGLLRDKDDEDSLISVVHVSDVPSLKKQNIVKGGMIPKIECCVEAVRRGVKRTHIIDGRIPHSILIEMLTDEGIGTMFL